LSALCAARFAGSPGPVTWPWARSGARQGGSAGLIVPSGLAVSRLTVSR